VTGQSRACVSALPAKISSPQLKMCLATLSILLVLPLIHSSNHLLKQYLLRFAAAGLSAAIVGISTTLSTVYEFMI
jgi:hypothetical protein